jgi:signal transduction histidine kinase
MGMNENPQRHQPPAPAELAPELLRAVDDERERVAREIHDELAQELFALRLLAESVAEASGEDRTIRARRVAELAARVEQTARDLAHSYSSLSESGGNFGRAVRALVQRHEGRVLFDLSALPEIRLDGSTTSHLHRIVQEAVTNAVRHGAATHIRIALESDGPVWRLCVEDNGTGFDFPDTPAGLGLRSMTYRAAQIGGSLRVERNGGPGMRIVCEFPERK